MLPVSVAIPMGGPIPIAALVAAGAAVYFAIGARIARKVVRARLLHHSGMGAAGVVGLLLVAWPIAFIAYRSRLGRHEGTRAGSPRHRWDQSRQRQHS